MDKIIHPISKQIPFVNLYLDDITEILEILENEKFDKIEIKTLTHIYSKDEIKTIKPNEQITDIYSHNPFYISINFNNRNGIHLYSSNDSTLAEGVIKKIESILQRQKRRVSNFLIKYKHLLTTILPIVIVILFIKNIITMAIFVIALILGSILNTSLTFVKYFNKNIFYLINKSERSSFFIRNKDELILLIISNVFTMLITLFISYLSFNK